MKIYLAARYSRKAEVGERARELQELGYEVTCEWVWRQKEKDEATPAQLDLEDVGRSDMVVMFTDPPGIALRGGKHFELGYAYARGKWVGIIGQPEHIFHSLWGIRRFDRWDTFLAYLEDKVLEELL